MNTISIMGRITADLKCEYTSNGNAVLHFNVAVKRPHTQDTTDFIRCVAWRNKAEFIERYFKKGKYIAITGIMTSRSWKDDNQKNHTVMELLVDDVDFCGDKDKTKTNENGFNAVEKAENQEDRTTDDFNDDIPDSFQSAEEDIPF